MRHRKCWTLLHIPSQRLGMWLANMADFCAIGCEFLSQLAAGYVASPMNSNTTTNAGFYPSQRLGMWLARVRCSIQTC